MLVLMGYGFAIDKNKCDSYAMAISKPMPEAHAVLKQKLPERFVSEEWLPEEALFFTRPSWHFNGGYPETKFPYLKTIDPDLIIVLHIMVSTQLGGLSDMTPVDIWMIAIDAVLGRLEESRDCLVESSALLPEKTSTRRAHMANIYRENQLHMIQESIGMLEGFLYRVNEGEEDLGALLHGQGLITLDELNSS
jgi:hypothetical protein